MVLRAVPKRLPPVRQAVSTTVRMAASPSAAHIARYPLVTFRCSTAGRGIRSEPL